MGKNHLLSSWNNQDPLEMARKILDSKMPLDPEERELIEEIIDDAETASGRKVSIYELYHLNILCYMVIGYDRKDWDLCE